MHREQACRHVATNGHRTITEDISIQVAYAQVYGAGFYPTKVDKGHIQKHDTCAGDTDARSRSI